MALKGDLAAIRSKPLLNFDHSSGDQEHNQIGQNSKNSNGDFEDEVNENESTITKNDDNTKESDKITSGGEKQMNWFKEFVGLSRSTLIGLDSAKYFKPTEIQRETIPLAMRGLDILGSAKTGSGKTLAFLVPILECLHRERWSQQDGLGALIITPTRELAYQIFEVLRKIGKCHSFSAGLIIGGKDLKFERSRMDRLNIIICTPGRLKQHMDENYLFHCDNLKMLVIDEADRILDMGFKHDMNAILEFLPRSRQCLLFSATQTRSVKDLARLSLKDPVLVSVHENSDVVTPETLGQSFVVVDLHEKLNFLWSFLREHKYKKILVFLATCKQTKYVHDLFCRMRPGTTLLALYGTLHQLKRMEIYDRFCKAKNAILVATDVVARGLDFPNVDWVVQLDSPEDVTCYIHRAGRTARFNRVGHSLLCVMPHEREKIISAIQQRGIPILENDRITNSILQRGQSSFGQSIQRKAEALCARDVQLKESAKRAFKAYLKYLANTRDKNVFDPEKLDLTSFSHSLGLAITPRVRMLERRNIKLSSKANENKSLSKTLLKPGTKSDENFDSDSDSSNNIKDSNSRNDIKRKLNSKIHSIGDGDDDSDDNDDLLIPVNKRVKTQSQSDDDNHEKQNDIKSSNVNDSSIAIRESELDSEFFDALEPRRKKNQNKPVSKEALIKKDLKKKNIQWNKRIVFDEQGKPVQEFAPNRQQSDKVQQVKVNSKLNIELARQVLKEEDEIDRQIYKSIRQEKKWKEKKKLKQKKDKSKNSYHATLENGDDDGGDDDDDADDDGDSVDFDTGLAGGAIIGVDGDDDDESYSDD